jgi:hypothetical protein
MRPLRYNYVLLELAFVCLMICGGAAMANSAEDKTTMLLHSALNRGVVNNADLALKIAELLVANAYGPEQLERQRPLSVEEQDDAWVVTGNYNKDRKIEGWGPARVAIKKRDAQITDLEVPYILPVPPEAGEIIERYKSKPK